MYWSCFMSDTHNILLALCKDQQEMYPERCSLQRSTSFWNLLVHHTPAERRKRRHVPTPRHFLYINVTWIAQSSHMHLWESKRWCVRAKNILFRSKIRRKGNHYLNKVSNPFSFYCVHWVLKATIILQKIAVYIITDRLVYIITHTSVHHYAYLSIH